MTYLRLHGQSILNIDQVHMDCHPGQIIITFPRIGKDD